MLLAKKIKIKQIREGKGGIAKNDVHSPLGKMADGAYVARNSGVIKKSVFLAR